MLEDYLSFLVISICLFSIKKIWLRLLRNNLVTRMHSSRKRTIRFSGYFGWVGSGCLPRECLSGVVDLGGCLPRGPCLRGSCLGGCLTACVYPLLPIACWDTPPCGQTHATFPQLLLREVITFFF